MAPRKAQASVTDLIVEHFMLASLDEALQSLALAQSIVRAREGVLSPSSTPAKTRRSGGRRKPGAPKLPDPLDANDPPF